MYRTNGGIIEWRQWSNHIYRPRSEANEGYVFTGVCHSVTERGGGGGGGGGRCNHVTFPSGQGQRS